MKLRLFDANDKSENTVGWIVFDAENMRLLDITNDEKNPERLEFDKTIWNKIIACLFNNDRSFCFDENEKEQKNEIKLDHIFPINEDNGMWSEDCNMDNSDQLLYYSNRKIIFTVDGVHFICAIELKEINKNEFDMYLAKPSNEISDGAFFSTDELPGGKKFENFSQQKPIAKIVSIDDSKIAFTWFGFYNIVTKERVLLKKNYVKNNDQEITLLLKNCKDE